MSDLVYLSVVELSSKVVDSEIEEGGRRDDIVRYCVEQHLVSYGMRAYDIL